MLATDVLLLWEMRGPGLAERFGRLSKWLWVADEMAESWSISDEMTSGDAACVRMWFGERFLDGRALVSTERACVLTDDGCDSLRRTRSVWSCEAGGLSSAWAWAGPWFVYAAPWVPAAAAVRASIVSMFGTLGRPQPGTNNSILESGAGVVPERMSLAMCAGV